MRLRERLADVLLGLLGVEQVAEPAPAWPDELLGITLGHTPGPWRVNDKWDIDIIGSDHEVVAEIIWDRARGSVCRANERLIAVAPEMLDALIAYEEVRALCGAGSGFEKEIDAAERRFDDIRAKVFERLRPDNDG